MVGGGHDVIYCAYTNELDDPRNDDKQMTNTLFVYPGLYSLQNSKSESMSEKLMPFFNL